MPCCRVWHALLAPSTEYLVATGFTLPSMPPSSPGDGEGSVGQLGHLIGRSRQACLLGQGSPDLGTLKPAR